MPSIRKRIGLKAVAGYKGVLRGDVVRAEELMRQHEVHSNHCYDLERSYWISDRKKKKKQIRKHVQVLKLLLKSGDIK